MLSARILATGQHYQPLDDAGGLPVLTAALAEVCPQRIRRIDRFTQLALLGSGRCARQHRPTPTCGVYLGAGVGPLSSNIEVQNFIVRQHELPMPVGFINTLGGGAAFHIAANLGLHGPASCQSRTEGSLEAVLASALLDLHAGVTDQALVGVVEEIVLPVATQRQRHGMPEQRLLAEGSHWWLLAGDDNDTDGARLHWHANLEMDALTQQLSRMGEMPLCLSRSLDSASAASVRTRFAQAEDTKAMAFHDSIEAAWLQKQVGACALIGSDAAAGLNLFQRLA